MDIAKGIKTLSREAGILASLAISCLFPSSCVTDSEPENNGVQVGDMLPYFSVILDNDETISTPDLKGKVSVIEFFNTSCPDCRESLPQLQIAYDTYKDNENVCIFTISREENAESIDTFWRQEGLSLPYSPQNDWDVYYLFATVGIPRIYVSDREGKIVYTYGDTDIPSAATLEKNIESILSQP